ncbi:hypothetical protein [Pseudoxanthomonas broegbernensis]|uniref:hypothetical protein n=1 Tax=Pseudoxanthomonas broegbernensis TaxID=83619 RepID=UPI00179E7742|nr:hypothetical protein [Pseudoxanthomonas broegbernensis]MBB6064892.1 phage FluMu protein gp41 [Pseudoxanthomonas broegbernensis]
MSIISTEVEFTLPIGYRDEDGNLHRNGVMRLATAGDEILPLKDHRVQANPAYLSIIVLARVVVKLGTLDMISTRVIEDLFSADFAYLQDHYNRINQVEGAGANVAEEAAAPQGKAEVGRVDGRLHPISSMQR